jgi:hypothetical protein
MMWLFDDADLGPLTCMHHFSTIRNTPSAGALNQSLRLLWVANYSLIDLLGWTQQKTIRNTQAMRQELNSEEYVLYDRWCEVLMKPHGEWWFLMVMVATSSAFSNALLSHSDPSMRGRKFARSNDLLWRTHRHHRKRLFVTSMVLFAMGSDQQACCFLGLKIKAFCQR